MLSQYPSFEDYYLEVSRGNVPGARLFDGYGERVTSGAETNILWPNGTYALPPAAGVQMSVVSSTANDTAGGTGIRTLRMFYLDANLEEQEEDITMNGTTPVLTSATDIRMVQCMVMLTYGSGGAADGNISAYVGAQNYSYISAGSVRCSSSVRMVPKGKRLLVGPYFGGAVSGSAGAKVIIRSVTSYFGGVDYSADSIFIPTGAAAYQDNSGGVSSPFLGALTEGMAFGMQFEADKAATIVGTWFGVLEDA